MSKRTNQKVCTNAPGDAMLTTAVPATVPHHQRSSLHSFVVGQYAGGGCNPTSSDGFEAHARGLCGCPGLEVRKLSNANDRRAVADRHVACRWHAGLVTHVAELTKPEWHWIWMYDWTERVPSRTPSFSTRCLHNPCIPAEGWLQQHCSSTGVLCGAWWEEDLLYFGVRYSCYRS